MLKTDNYEPFELFGLLRMLPIALILNGKFARSRAIVNKRLLGERAKSMRCAPTLRQHITHKPPFLTIRITPIMSDYDDYDFESAVDGGDVEEVIDADIDENAFGAIGDNDDPAEPVAAGDDDGEDEEEEEDAEVELGDEDTDEGDEQDEDDYDEEEDDDAPGDGEDQGDEEDVEDEDEELGTAALVRQDLIADDPDDYEEEKDGNDDDEEEEELEDDDDDQEDEEEDAEGNDEEGEPDSKRARIEQ